MALIIARGQQGTTKGVSKYDVTSTESYIWYIANRGGTNPLFTNEQPGGWEVAEYDGHLTITVPADAEIGDYSLYHSSKGGPGPVVEYPFSVE